MAARETFVAYATGPGTAGALRSVRVPDVSHSADDLSTAKGLLALPAARGPARQAHRDLPGRGRPRSSRGRAARARRPTSTASIAIGAGGLRPAPTVSAEALLAGRAHALTITIRAKASTLPSSHCWLDEACVCFVLRNDPGHSWPHPRASDGAMAHRARNGLRACCGTESWRRGTSSQGALEWFKLDERPQATRRAAGTGRSLPLTTNVRNLAHGPVTRHLFVHRRAL
jgi:hypothetical protein